MLRSMSRFRKEFAWAVEVIRGFGTGGFPHSAALAIIPVHRGTAVHLRDPIFRVEHVIVRAIIRLVACGVVTKGGVAIVGITAGLGTDQTRCLYQFTRDLAGS